MTTERSRSRGMAEVSTVDAAETERSRSRGLAGVSTVDAAGTERIGLTPSQTVGPFLHIGLPWADGPDVVTEGGIVIEGRVYDGSGAPVPDALVETWQADGDGRFSHPDDPRGPGTKDFRGFGRCPTDVDGWYRIRTVKPGPLPTVDGRTEAPHIDVSVFARGLLDRVVTRLYFPDEPANETDPVLSTVDDVRRGTLVATAVDGGYRFDVRLRGPGETVFFDV